MLRGNDPFIFISYAREDQDLVDREVRYIKGLGCEVWIDKREVRGGRLWDEEIRDAIQRCACFVVFLTRISVNSDNVKKEIALALELKKPFIHVSCANVKLPSELHSEVRKIQGLEQYSLVRSTFEQQLSGSLQSYVTLTASVSPKKQDVDEKASNRNTPDRTNGISPGVIVFVLKLLAIFFLLFGIVAMVVPLFASQTPGDPLNNKLVGFLTGSLLIAIAGGLRTAAFLVNRFYLRRENA